MLEFISSPNAVPQYDEDIEIGVIIPDETNNMIKIYEKNFLKLLNFIWLFSFWIKINPEIKTRIIIPVDSFESIWLNKLLDNSKFGITLIESKNCCIWKSWIKISFEKVSNELDI